MADTDLSPDTRQADTAPASVNNDHAPKLSQPSLAPHYEASGTRNPLHTSIQSTMAPTSEFVRYFLLALPARYVFRGALGLATDPKIGHPDNPTFINRIFTPFRRTVDRIIDRGITNNIEHRVNEELALRPLSLAAGPGKATPSDTFVTTALGTENGKTLKKNVSRILGGWDASNLTHNMIQHAYDNEV